jgi:hypothetical protein
MQVLSRKFDDIGHSTMLLRQAIWDTKVPSRTDNGQVDGAQKTYLWIGFHF